MMVESARSLAHLEARPLTTWATRMFGATVGHDAAAFALERLMLNAETVRPESACAWLRVVCRHEAYRLTHLAQRDAPLEDQRRDGRALHEVTADPAGHDELDAVLDEPDPRLPALRRALENCKPDERAALLAFYDLDWGAATAQIMRDTGWTRTKVNRLLTEGRAAIRREFGIEPERRAA